MTSNRKDKRIANKTSDRLLGRGFQKRTLWIDSDEGYAYEIERAAVFGSYVNSDCEPLGDLDIGVLPAKVQGRQDEEPSRRNRAPVSAGAECSRRQ